LAPSASREDSTGAAARAFSSQQAGVLDAVLAELNPLLASKDHVDEGS